MPLMRMQMDFSNRNIANARFVRNVQVPIQSRVPQLYGSMVGRVHNIKSGCGSCGRSR